MNEDQSSPDAIPRAAEAISAADSLLITAGAGMGVDSGLPDFRGTEGFWNAYPHAKRLGLSFPDLANPRWFADDPELAWGFYGHRANLYHGATPHRGFDILHSWSEEKPLPPFVFTSNVDGHFQLSGFPSVWECHGSIHFGQCLLPCSEDIWQLDHDALPEIDLESFRAAAPLPRCKNCDAVARPNILMFGDFSWIGQRDDEQRRQFERWSRETINRNGAKVTIIEIGAGTGVPTVRIFSEMKRSAFRATLIRINKREPQISDGEGISIQSGGLDALEAISAELGVSGG